MTGHKAVFNVTTFNGVTFIQCNRNMVGLLVDFIGDVQGELEPEIYALMEHLKKAERPEKKGPSRRRTDRPMEQ